MKPAAPSALKSLLCLVLVCLVCSAAFGQNTWNDLYFGASLSEVQASLARHNQDLQKVNDIWIVRPGWDFKSPGIKIPFHFIPNLSFSDDDKLERIKLTLQGEQNGAAYHSAATSIRDQLIGQYGAPITETGSCTATKSADFVNSPRDMECKAMWRAQRQIVTLTWSFLGEGAGVRKFLFSITYVPVRDGL